jgi:hypothetical protein
MPSRSRSDVSKFKRKRRTYRPCWKRSVCLGKLGLVCGLLYVAGLLLWQRARLALPRVRLLLEEDDDRAAGSGRGGARRGSIREALPAGMYLGGPSCLELQARYGVQPMRAWGRMPQSVRPLWRQLHCNEALFRMALPGARVEAQKAGALVMGHWGEHPPELVFDGRVDTFFWSDGAMGSGDSVTVLLSPAAVLTEAGVLTGENGKDECESCELQVSSDGVHFETVAKLVGGAADVSSTSAVAGGALRPGLRAGGAGGATGQLLKRVRAVRLLVTKAQTSWLKVREFNVKTYM